jgi:hypothetical protein
MLILCQNLPFNITDELRRIIDDHLEINIPAKPGDIGLSRSMHGDQGATEASPRHAVSTGTTLDTNRAAPWGSASSEAEAFILGQTECHQTECQTPLNWDNSDPPFS